MYRYITCNDIALLANDGSTQTLPTAVSAIIVVLFYCFVDFSCNCLLEQNKTLMILISKVENFTTFSIILLSQKKIGNSPTAITISGTRGLLTTADMLS